MAYDGGNFYGRTHSDVSSPTVIEDAQVTLTGTTGESGVFYLGPLPFPRPPGPATGNVKLGDIELSDFDTETIGRVATVDAAGNFLMPTMASKSSRTNLPTYFKSVPRFNMRRTWNIVGPTRTFTTFRRWNWCLTQR